MTPNSWRSGRGRSTGREHSANGSTCRNAYGSYEELAADPSVDIVYVATPQSSHERDTLMFLEAGKHVSCEKPFALNAAQGQRMVDTARDRGLFLMEAMWARFLPPYRRLVELLDDGVIGEPRLVEADFGYVMPRDPAHRLWDASRGGGGLLDLGVYPVQLASLVLGAPTRVAAAGFVGPYGVDEQVAAVLGHPSGALAVVKAAIATSLTCTARITGTLGTIELPAFMHCPGSLTIVRLGQREMIDTPWPWRWLAVPGGRGPSVPGGRGSREPVDAAVGVAVDPRHARRDP